MSGFRWIQMFLLTIIMLQSAAEAAECSDNVVRDGKEITLSCGKVTNGEDKCSRTTWLFTTSNKTEVKLFENGKMLHSNNTGAESGRLSVTADCSLVIKNVTFEDVGRYTCRKLNGSEPEVPGSAATLSVVNMTQHEKNNVVTLNCSVLTYDGCNHTVKWLYEDKDINNKTKDLKTSQSNCSATVNFTTSSDVYKSNNSESFKCQVTNNGTVKNFTFTIHLPHETPGPGFSLDGWWKFVVVAVVLTVLLVIIVTAIWRSPKRNKPRMSDNTADPEDAVPYASISFTKNTNRKANVKGKNDDEEEDETVTYSTVKACLSSVGAVAEPSDLYAIVNRKKGNK